MRAALCAAMLTASVMNSAAFDFATSQSVFSTYSGPTYLTLPGQVSINLQDGSMKFEPGYSPDAAARQFWEAMSQDYRDMLKWKAEHGR